MSEEEQILSVSDFTGLVKGVLQTAFPEVWVRGEVSNLARPSSGHVYLSLKDAKSQLSCVMFQRNARSLSPKIKDGSSVLACGQVNVYEPRGQYQLVLHSMQLDGDGELLAAFEALKKRLHAEGLFALDRKMPIPKTPQTIAVITSSTGAAIKDFIGILDRRMWRGRVIIIHASVQGETAPAQLIKGLRHAQGLPGVDLIVLTRGGGSLEDLWSFNDESLVREISACSIPLISAVGHEVDYTLCDFVADLRAETPSGAAELISSAYFECKEHVHQLQMALHRSVSQIFEQCRNRLNLLEQKIEHLSPLRKIDDASMKMDELALRMRHALIIALNLAKQNLASKQRQLEKIAPQRLVDEYRRDLQHWEHRFVHAAKQNLRRDAEALKALSLRLSNSSMQRVLDRGYALVLDETGKPISEASQLKAHQRLQNRFRDGTARVQVIEVQK